MPLDTPVSNLASRICIKQHSILFTYASTTSRLKWHVRLTFSAIWLPTATYKSRVSAAQRLVRRIHLERIPFLHDTVTEVVVSSHHDSAALLPLPLRRVDKQDAEQDDISLPDSWYYIREDPWRVRFPSYTCDATTRMVPLSVLSKERPLAPGVSVVRLAGDERESYVYKEIERPLYTPDDTKMIELEMQHLKLLRNANTNDDTDGGKYVVRFVAAVISDNPYRTSIDGADAEQQTVARGILLEYHTGGSLEEALSTAEIRQIRPVESTNAPTPQDKRPWRGWAVQVAHGLQYLHEQGLAHLDLKPSNVVISGAGQAVIIDISGWAGTHEYLAPEVREVFHLAQLGLEVRVRNDCWALGRLFERMALAAGLDGQDADGEVLEAAASRLTVHEPEKRMGIAEAVSFLQGVELTLGDGRASSLQEVWRGQRNAKDWLRDRLSRLGDLVKYCWGIFRPDRTRTDTGGSEIS